MRKYFTWKQQVFICCCPHCSNQFNMAFTCCQHPPLSMSVCCNSDFIPRAFITGVTCSLNATSSSLFNCEQRILLTLCNQFVLKVYFKSFCVCIHVSANFSCCNDARWSFQSSDIWPSTHELFTCPGRFDSDDIGLHIPRKSPLNNVEITANYLLLDILQSLLICHRC